jgi:hypothetical protein
MVPRSAQGKVTLHELCRAMGLPGKPSDISGEEVEKYYRDGHIANISKGRWVQST